MCYRETDMSCFSQDQDAHYCCIHDVVVVIGFLCECQDVLAWWLFICKQDKHLIIIQDNYINTTQIFKQYMVHIKVIIYDKRLFIFLRYRNGHNQMHASHLFLDI